MVQVAGLYKIIGTRNAVFIGITCGFTSTGSINFLEIYKKYPKIFKDLRVCDLMTGIGAPYLLSEFKQEITMIESTNIVVISKKKFSSE